MYHGYNFKIDAEIGQVPTIQVTETNRSYLFIMFFFKPWLLKDYVYDAVLIIGRLKMKSSSVPKFFRPKGIKRCTACVGLEARHVRLHATFWAKPKLFFFFHSATAPSGQGPPHYRGLTITLRLITFSRTHLDE
jgi:hypothetical protein